jgi:bacillithiol biosynthesis cysteine-adding enzyme BshC
MTSDCLPFTAVPHSSQLFRDYLYNFERVQQFYARDPRQRPWIAEVARALPYDDARRQKLADALERQNRGWDASEQTMAAIGRLRAGAAAAVTGQQVGLFGGPLFALLKALSAARLAEEARELGVDCVPVFWLATEDHDLAEVNHATLLAADGKLVRLAVEPQGPQTAGAPISDLRLGPEIEPVVAQAAALLGENESSDFLRQAYRPGETLGSAFARLFARLFAEWGVILLDASDPALHRLAQPVYRAAVIGAEEIDNALLARGKALRAAGYHEQVKVTPSSTLLFEKRNGARTVIHRSNGGFIAGEERLSQQQLLEQIAAAPERFSANVLLRPVVQDFLLPTIAYTGGPAEVAYFAQAAVVYEEVLGRLTPVLPRFSATLLDARAQRLLAKYGLKLPDLFHGPGALRELLALRSLPAELQGSFHDAERSLAATLDRLQQELEKLDPTLVEAARRARSKMDYQLGRLRRRAAKAELRRQQEISAHAEWLSNALYPNKNLQERELAGVGLLARHGRELLRGLYECAKSGCVEHQVIAI